MQFSYDDPEQGNNRKSVYGRDGTYKDPNFSWDNLPDKLMRGEFRCTSDEHTVRPKKSELPNSHPNHYYYSFSVSEIDQRFGVQEKHKNSF